MASKDFSLHSHFRIGGAILVVGLFIYSPQTYAQSGTQSITASPANVTLTELLEGFEIDEVEVPADMMPFLTFVAGQDPNSISAEVTETGGVSILVGAAEIIIDAVELESNVIEYCGTVTTPAYEGAITGSISTMDVNEIESVEFLTSEAELLETNPTAFVRMTFNHDAIDGALTSAPCSIITTFAPHSELATEFQSLPVAFSVSDPPQNPPMPWPGDDGVILWTGVSHWECKCEINGQRVKVCPNGMTDCEDPQQNCYSGQNQGQCVAIEVPDRCETSVAYVTFTFMALGVVRCGRTRSGSA